ncbi:MAG: hypothetical protein ACRDJW_17950, partial [Thermomicrobiales bacterium]
MRRSRVELNDSECIVLAEALGDTPETVMGIHRLRRGLCRALVAGAPEWPRAAVVQAHALPTEPAGYGADADQLWTLLRDVDGWEAVN